MAKKQRLHLYHVSTLRLGSITAERRTPLYADPKEPPTPRLCVCPSVPACLAARLFPVRELYVYRTERPLRGVSPVGVWDSLITKERWLIPPAKLVRVGTITEEEVHEAQGDIRRFHRMTRKHSSHRLRVAQLEMAWRVLEGKFPIQRERRFSQRLCRMFLEGVEPVEFIESEIEKVKGKVEQ